MTPTRLQEIKEHVDELFGAIALSLVRNEKCLSMITLINQLKL